FSFAGTITGRNCDLERVRLTAREVSSYIRRESEDVTGIAFTDRIEIALRIEPHSFVRLAPDRRPRHRSARERMEFIDQASGSFLSNQQRAPWRPDDPVEPAPLWSLRENASHTSLEVNHRDSAIAADFMSGEKEAASFGTGFVKRIHVG